ncbi:replication-relaxation family protein [Streptomyces tauricus]|uniref:replication-relaxation family protein n=1 Tax=Streptomyces tauricus TaxID=68274 RepID=UPI003821AE0C
MRRDQRVRAARVVRLRPGAAGPLGHGGEEPLPRHDLVARGAQPVDLIRRRDLQDSERGQDVNKLSGLTPLGLDAAAEVLGRPASEMGSTARGAARSGAPHATAVNETIIAITRTAPEPTRPVRRTARASVRSASGERPAVIPGARAELPAVPAASSGVGSVSSWSTEVAMALPCAGRNRATVQTDAVLHAPEAGVPVLLFEVDNCTESADVLAGKFDRCRRFFRQKAARDHQGREPCPRVYGADAPSPDSSAPMTPSPRPMAGTVPAAGPTSGSSP